MCSARRNPRRQSFKRNTERPERASTLHVTPYSETITAEMETISPALDDFSLGYFLGLLAGEGHFGGDGRQAHITLRMHVRHEGLFRWLELAFPGGRLYGPYNHGGRAYFQWMARGPFLKRDLIPLIAKHAYIFDDHVRGRFESMRARYRV